MAKRRFAPINAPMTEAAKAENVTITGDWTFTGTVTGAGGGIENVVEDTTPQLGGTLDANTFSIDMGTNLITDTKVGQWDTAYSWGDHASAGYLDAADIGVSVQAWDADLDTVASLGLHASDGDTAPGADKILRSNTNGYVYLGWINTVSGSTTNDPTRIYCSNDSFIRYHTPATFIDFLQDETWDVGGAWTFSTQPSFSSGVDIQGIVLEEASSRTGLLEVNRDGTNSYAGLSIYFSSTAQWQLMASQTTCGLYDDYNNEWGWIMYENSYLRLYNNGSVVVETHSDGMRRYNRGSFYHNESSSYLSGGVTFSTGAASGGSSGDIWYQYT